MRRDDDILRINQNNAQNDLLARISSIETNARNYNQVIDVVNNKSPDAEHHEHSVDNSVVKLSPSPPENGPAILMPSGVGVNGRPDWETVEFSRCTNKVSRGVKSGLQKRNKYLQPIDLVIPYAGSEASSAKGDYGIEDSQAEGFFAEQAALAVKIQNAVGEVANTTANPKPKRPFLRLHRCSIALQLAIYFAIATCTVWLPVSVLIFPLFLRSMERSARAIQSRGCVPVQSCAVMLRGQIFGAGGAIIQKK